MLGNKHTCKFCQTKFYNTTGNPEITCPICGNSVIEEIKQQLLRKITSKKLNSENISLILDDDNIDEFDGLFHSEQEIDSD